MKGFSIGAAVIMSIAVSACTTVRSDVTRFSDPAVSYSGMTFAFLPDKEQELSLEFQDYAGYVASKLAAQGMVQAPLDQADFVVLMKYGVDSGRTVSGTTPIYGQTGGGAATYSGTVYGQDGWESYDGTIYTPETYGVIDQVPWSTTEYTRAFGLRIVAGLPDTSGKAKPVYQANVTSVGSSNTFFSVSRCVIDAAFDGFPNASWASRTVTVSGDKCIR